MILLGAPHRGGTPHEDRQVGGQRPGSPRSRASGPRPVSGRGGERHGRRAARREHGGDPAGGPVGPGQERDRGDARQRSQRAPGRAGPARPPAARQLVRRRALRLRDRLGVRGVPAVARLHRPGRERPARPDLADPARRRPVPRRPAGQPGLAGDLPGPDRQHPHAGHAAGGAGPGRAERHSHAGLLQPGWRPGLRGHPRRRRRGRHLGQRDELHDAHQRGPLAA